MNRHELCLALAEKEDITPEEARRVVDITFDQMKGALLDDGRIEFRGFGSFAMKEYKPYTGRDPRTGEDVKVKPKKLPFFRCGKDLYELVNGKN